MESSHLEPEAGPLRGDYDFLPEDWRKRIEDIIWCSFESNITVPCGPSMHPHRSLSENHRSCRNKSVVHCLCLFSVRRTRKLGIYAPRRSKVVVRKSRCTFDSRRSVFARCKCMTVVFCGRKFSKSHRNFRK